MPGLAIKELGIWTIIDENPLLGTSKLLKEGRKAARRLISNDRCILISREHSSSQNGDFRLTYIRSGIHRPGDPA